LVQIAFARWLAWKWKSGKDSGTGIGHTNRLTDRQRNTICNKPAANLLYPTAVLTTCYQNVFK
jgi:hypothetical protein